MGTVSVWTTAVLPGPPSDPLSNSQLHRPSRACSCASWKDLLGDPPRPMAPGAWPPSPTLPRPTPPGWPCRLGPVLTVSLLPQTGGRVPRPSCGLRVTCCFMNSTPRAQTGPQRCLPRATPTATPSGDRPQPRSADRSGLPQPGWLAICGDLLLLPHPVTGHLHSPVPADRWEQCDLHEGF